MRKLFSFFLFLALSAVALSQKDTTDYSTLKSSYQGIVESGYAWGYGTYGMNNFRVTFVNSLKTGPYFSMGIGIGLQRKYEKAEFYEKGKWPSIGNKMLMPVYLDFRVNLSDHKVAPFLALDIGGYLGIYGFNAGLKGGLYFNPSGGIRIKVSPGSALLIGIDYQLLIMEFFDSSVYPNAEYTREKVGSAGIKIGFIF